MFDISLHLGYNSVCNNYLIRKDKNMIKLTQSDRSIYINPGNIITMHSESNTAPDDGTWVDVIGGASHLVKESIPEILRKITNSNKPLNYQTKG
jgi:uncharacterized protein YlzI (FlbEa/FlbD family)